MQLTKKDLVHALRNVNDDVPLNFCLDRRLYHTFQVVVDYRHEDPEDVDECLVIHISNAPFESLEVYKNEIYKKNKPKS